VIDFIDFHVWPVFNLADSAIVIGTLIVLFAGLRHETSRDDH
jgi:signal peptidase II